MERKQGEGRAPTDAELAYRYMARDVMRKALESAPAVFEGTEMVHQRGSQGAFIEQLYAAGVRSRGERERFSPQAVSSWTDQDAPVPPRSDVLLAAAALNNVRVDEVLYGKSLAEEVDSLRGEVGEIRDQLARLLQEK